MNTLRKALTVIAAVAAITPLSLPATLAASPTIDVSRDNNAALRAWGKSIGKLLKKEMGTPEHFDTAPKYGTVTYLMTVNRDGTVLSARRVQSTGYKQLDESAANTIAAMQSLPKMPDSLAAPAARVQIRMAYLPMKSSSFLRSNSRKAKTKTLDLADQQSGLRITLLDTVPGDTPETSR